MYGLPSLRLAWIWIVLLSAGGVTADEGDRAGHVHTNRKGTKRLPLPREEGVWHFVVFGDRTGGPAAGIQVLDQAVADTNLLDPDLVMTVGDLVEGYNGPRRWLEQTREYQTSMDRLRMPWYPVAGNHDIYWRPLKNAPPGQHEANYEKHFGPLWYSFRHKNAGFVILYTDEGDPRTGTKGLRLASHQSMSPEQMSWLRETLASLKTLSHVFVFVHHPRWITTRYPGNNWNEVHAILAGAGNVTAVFGGHIHQMHYAGPRDGIEYFTLATTGGHQQGGLPEVGWLHHFNVVTVREAGIHSATIPVGAVVDPRSVTQELIDDVRLALAALSPRLEAPLVLSGDGTSSGECVLELTNPSSRPVEATVELATVRSGWRFLPDHTHVKLEPGETRRTSVRYDRTPIPLSEPTPSPEARITVDYLAEDARITLPEKRKRLDTRLTGIDVVPTTGPDRDLVLDGRGCVEVPSSTLPLPDGPLTLEGWIRAPSYRGRRPFITKTENSEFGIFVSHGRPDFSVHLDGKYRQAANEDVKLVPNRWHHVAGVYDGQEVRLYVDGKQVAAAPASGRRTRNDFAFFVGADPNRRGDPVDRLVGRIDEVRISRVARYTEDFDPGAPGRRHDRDGDTLLLLHLDHDLGPFTPDASSTGAHGIRVGTARLQAGD